MKNSLLIFLVFLISISLINCRPAMQRIRINNHEWEVPNEPGWDEVIREAEAMQRRFFETCRTAFECRKMIDELRRIFLRYPVSKKFLENNSSDGEDIFSSIFKWG